MRASAIGRVPIRNLPKMYCHFFHFLIERFKVFVDIFPIFFSFNLKVIWKILSFIEYVIIVFKGKTKIRSIYLFTCHNLVKQVDVN